MSFLQRLFASKHQDAAPTSRPQSHLASGMSQTMGQTQNGTRRELLRVVLRDTLNKHGIPSAWIGADALGSTSSEGHRGIHWRLVVKHWDPRLLTHGVALQQALIKRVTMFDPLASEWLTGISWQFALADESVCPPLPEASTWTADGAAHESPILPATASAAPVTEPVAAFAQDDVLAGPIRIVEPSDAEAARADLEALMAIRNADFQAHGEA